MGSVPYFDAWKFLSGGDAAEKPAEAAKALQRGQIDSQVSQLSQGSPSACSAGVPSLSRVPGPAKAAKPAKLANDSSHVGDRESRVGRDGAGSCSVGEGSSTGGETDLALMVAELANERDWLADRGLLLPGEGDAAALRAHFEWLRAERGLDAAVAEARRHWAAAVACEVLPLSGHDGEQPSPAATGGEA